MCYTCTALLLWMHLILAKLRFCQHNLFQSSACLSLLLLPIGEISNTSKSVVLPLELCLHEGFPLAQLCHSEITSPHTLANIAMQRFVSWTGLSKPNQTKPKPLQSKVLLLLPFTYVTRVISLI